MPRQISAAFFLVFLTAPAAPAQSVRIGIFGIFHPRQLILAASDETLVVNVGNERIFLEPKSASAIAQIRTSEHFLVLEFEGFTLEAKNIRAVGRDNGPASFVLSVPGKIQRRYVGTLDVTLASEVAVPVVTMDLETAVASVVQAESSPDAPLEALKAQAIVTRSYFAAGTGRHRDFDFCDLTHCQFLREPPIPGSPAATASAATRGLIIQFRDEPVAAMFTRSCGGRTRTPAEIGLPTSGYPFYSVICNYCYQNPARWSRRVSKEDAAELFARGEAGRLSVDRRLGWDTVPSDNFLARTTNGEVVLEGVGQGHGVGLCQRGAKAMAEAGADFRQIIRHYFPNTSINQLSRRPEFITSAAFSGQPR